MTIGYKLHGSGSQGVIVLHGWLGDHTVFEPIYPALDFSTYTYAFLDYRGYGLSRDMTGEHSMDEISRDAIALADHLGWQTFHIVGHSMGGMAMQRLALDAPGRVKCGIAITPVPASGVAMDETRKALLAGAATNPENRRTIIDFNTSKRYSSAWLDYMVAFSQRTTTPEAFGDYMIAWSKTDFATEVKELSIPILVLAGEYDQALPAELLERTYMVWLSNARMETISNVGHYPMHERPVDLATRIENFMRDIVN